VRLIRSPLGKIRADAGFSSVAKAAQELAVSQSHLWNIECGRCGCSEALMLRMAELYSSDMAEIQHAINRGRLKLLKKLQTAIEAP
jgi:hypothetical protein